MIGKQTCVHVREIKNVGDCFVRACLLNLSQYCFSPMVLHKEFKAHYERLNVGVDIKSQNGDTPLPIITSLQGSYLY